MQSVLISYNKKYEPKLVSPLVRFSIVEMCIRDRYMTAETWEEHRLIVNVVVFKNFAITIAHESAPVSYTHLDVYKRQSRYSVVP